MYAKPLAEYPDFCPRLEDWLTQDTKKKRKISLYFINKIIF